MLEELKRTLNLHDWYHEMSDDYTVFLSGRNSRHKLLNLVSKAISVHGDEARRVVRDFYQVKLQHVRNGINPYSILKHYM